MNIDESIVNNLYSLILSKDFEKFIDFLKDLRKFYITQLIYVEKGAEEDFRILQGKIRMIEYIINVFNKEYFDKIKRGRKFSDNVGNTI